MKRNFTFMLAAIGLAFFALVPRLDAARSHERRGRATEGAGPRISEEAISIADAYRIDPSPDKLDALKRKVSYDYDVFLKDLRAKIRGNKQDQKNQDAYRRFETWSRDRDKQIDRIVKNLIKARKDKADSGSATAVTPTKK